MIEIPLLSRWSLAHFQLYLSSLYFSLSKVSSYYFLAYLKDIFPMTEVWSCWCCISYTGEKNTSIKQRVTGLLAPVRIVRSSVRDQRSLEMKWKVLRYNLLCTGPRSGRTLPIISALRKGYLLICEIWFVGHFGITVGFYELADSFFNHNSFWCILSSYFLSEEPEGHTCMSGRKSDIRARTAWLIQWIRLVI